MSGGWGSSWGSERSETVSPIKNRAFVWGVHHNGDVSSTIFLLPTGNPRTPDAYSQLLGEISTRYKREGTPWTGTINCHTKDFDGLVDEIAAVMEKCGFNVARRPITQEEDQAMHQGEHGPVRHTN
jgi:hypothetical protein